MAKVIINYGRSVGKVLAQELANANLDVCIAAKKKIEQTEDKYLPNSVIIPDGFGENQEFDEPKSKYINKPRHNFKRR